MDLIYFFPTIACLATYEWTVFHKLRLRRVWKKLVCEVWRERDRGENVTDMNFQFCSLEKISPFILKSPCRRRLVVQGSVATQHFSRMQFRFARLTRKNALRSGLPDGAIFRQLGDCLFWAVFNQLRRPCFNATFFYSTNCVLILGYIFSDFFHTPVRSLWFMPSIYFQVSVKTIRCVRILAVLIKPTTPICRLWFIYTLRCYAQSHCCRYICVDADEWLFASF
jgi:hypothetical protein